MDYRGAVFGLLPLGEARVDIDVDGESYRVTSTLRSSGLVSLFERTRLRAEAEGRIEAGRVRWDAYALDHHYSRKHRTISMRPAADGVAADINPNYRLWGQPPATDAQKSAARDPLSSLVAMAVDVARTRACADDYLTFDGRFLYRLELRGGEMRSFDGGGYEGPVLRCRMRYVPVAGFEPTDNGRRRRIPEGEIWFALIEGAPFAPPVRALAPLPLGQAGLSLTRLQRPNVDIAVREAAVTE